jgi:hypothetical protein
LCKITSRDDNGASVWNISRFVKILVLVQSFGNVFMGFWIYQEYLNNPFLQSYVNGYFRGSSLAAIILALIGLSTIVAVGLYEKLRGARKKLYGMRSRGTVGLDRGRREGPLDERTEQHLIEMIRKTQPILNSGTSDGMPTLRRIDSQSREE